MADYDVIFVLGGPGAGKGTVCHHLTVNYPGEWVHLSAGDLLRAERAKPGSALADQINKIINEGGIVPADVTVGLLSAAMAAASSSFQSFKARLPWLKRSATASDDNGAAAWALSPKKAPTKKKAPTTTQNWRSDRGIII